MTTLKKVWNWLKTHWYVPLTIVGAILGMFAGVAVQRRFNSPVDRTRDELKAIDAAVETSKKVQAEGVEAAIKHLEETHAETIKDADERATAKVERLRKRGNASALSKHLVRTGEKLRRDRERRG